MTPTVSMIVPLYNGERFLDAALDSVAAQTFGDFECICIDDGGKDRSAEIVGRRAASDPRFRLVRQENVGVATTRNRGIDLARGEYVAFLDQDDLLHPQFLEFLLAAIRRHDADMAACRSQDFFSDDGPGDRLAPVAPCDGSDDYASREPMEDYLYRTSSTPLMHSVWARLYRKSSIAGCRFPDGMYGADDYVFTMRTLSAASSFCAVPSTLHFHRSHQDNVTSAMPMRYILSMLDGVELVAEELFGGAGKHPLSDYARAAAKHIQHWGILLPCLKKYPREEMRALADRLRRLRRRRIIAFYSPGHAIRYWLVVHGRTALVRRLYPRLFEKMRKEH